MKFFFSGTSCYAFTPQGTMICAANLDLYNNMQACGRVCTVRCIGSNECRSGSVGVKIVDACATCETSGLDLSREAFSIIADPIVGKVQIDYIW